MADVLPAPIDLDDIRAGGCGSAFAAEGDAQAIVVVGSLDGVFGEIDR